MKTKKISKFLADAFASPCNYTFNGIDDISEFMGKCGDDLWCDIHCGNVGDDKCWKRFLKQLNKSDKKQDFEWAGEGD